MKYKITPWFDDPALYELTGYWIELFMAGYYVLTADHNNGRMARNWLYSKEQAARAFLVRK